jgi:hypothetical protein
MMEKLMFLNCFGVHVEDICFGIYASANFFKECLFGINFGRRKHI